MDNLVWAELYRMLQQLEGEAGRLCQHMDPTGHDRLKHVQDDIRHCATLVEGLLTGTPGSTAYMRLVGLSGAD